MAYLDAFCTEMHGQFTSETKSQNCQRGIGSRKLQNRWRRMISSTLLSPGLRAQPARLVGELAP